MVDWLLSYNNVWTQSLHLTFNFNTNTLVDGDAYKLNLLFTCYICIFLVCHWATDAMSNDNLLLLDNQNILSLQSAINMIS